MWRRRERARRRRRDRRPRADRRDLRFSPALPEATADGYARIGMADISKLHVALDERVAPDSIQTGEVPFWAYTAGEHDGLSSVVASAAGGPGHRAALALDGGDPAQYRARLAAAWPELRLGEHTLLTSWLLDPWARGALSYRPVLERRGRGSPERAARAGRLRGRARSRRADAQRHPVVRHPRGQ